jgi:hypothetical protein
MLCRVCKIEKALEDFAWKNKIAGTRNTTCKLCQSLYAKAHYISNADKYKNKAKQNRPIYVKRNKDYIIEYLKNNPCVDCGELDIEVLQFDHIDMIGEKGKRVGDFIGCALNTLKDQIKLCEVRCGNCHIRRTRKQMGWHRLSF